MSPKKRNTRIKKSEEVKEIEFKNYVISVLILVFSIFIAYYICEWMNVKDKEKYIESYLISSNSISNKVDNIDSLKQITSESPTSFIYFGYTNDLEEYNLEKELKKVIDKYGINEIFYYVDLTKEMKDNKDYINDINKIFNIDNLTNIPAIIYVNNGKVTDIIEGFNKSILDVESFEELLDENEFNKINK